MSRVGNKIIEVPDKVKVVLEQDTIKVEGPKGKLQMKLPPRVDLLAEGNNVRIKRRGETRQDKAMHGLTRALVGNMVLGASKGFQRRLEIQGVGFKANVQGKNLNLSLGKSHPIVYPVPDDIKVTVEDNTKILVEGVDKQRVGAVASDIRRYYPPEPYKGKGVRYSDEIVRRKEGKTAQGK